MNYEAASFGSASATDLCQRMTLPADTPIDQHVKRKRVCKFVTSFGVSALVKHDSLWRQGIQGQSVIRVSEE